MDFQTALKDLPEGTGFDSFVHKTVEDLCWLCLHELDMHAEGEYWHPAARRKKYLNFCRKYGFYEEEAQEEFELGKGLKKADAHI